MSYPECNESRYSAITLFTQKCVYLISALECTMIQTRLDAKVKSEIRCISWHQHLKLILSVYGGLDAVEETLQHF